MDKVVTRYTKSTDYKQHYANGALGGFDKNGEFVINFYTETFEIAESYINTFEGDNLVSTEVKNNDGEEGESVLRLLRTINSTIILSREKAENLYLWLQYFLGPKHKVDNESEEEITS